MLSSAERIPLIITLFLLLAVSVCGQMGLTHLPVTSVAIFELQPGKDGKSTLLRVGMRMFGFLDADVQTRYEGAWQMLAGQLKALAEK